MAGVSAATGAMNSLLGKLAALLGDEYKLLKQVRKEIEFLKRELGRMHAVLETLADMEKLDPLAKDWKGKVRDLSYDLEDCIDRFMDRLGNGNVKRRFMKKTAHRLKTLWARHDIATQIQELKARVVEESERRDRYKLEDYRPAKTVEIDPRLASLHQEVKGLVAIAGPMEKVINWLKDDKVVAELKVVAIVGSGGLGKTTLAMEVYRNIGGDFQCRASVPVSRSLDLDRLLKDVLSQIDKDEYEKCQRDRWEKEQLIREIARILTGKSEVGMDELHGARKGNFPPELDAHNNNIEESSNFTESHDPGNSEGMFSNVEERNEALDEYWNIIQMTFESEEHCYEFYNSYAIKKGFSVRKDIVRRKKKVGDMFYRRFVCSKEGIRDLEVSNIKDRKRRERAQTREDCHAQLSIRLDKDRGVWFVDNFVDEHNHNLTSPDETPFLRSHRKIKDHQKSEIVLMESMGIRKHVIMDVMECKHGGYDKVGFVRKDIYNFSSRYKRSRITDGDANAALEIMKARRDKDPDFFYEYELDVEGRLKNLLWSDAQSRMDYQAFGDVVIFDSTYRMNRYKMPFVPFVGINHHRQTTIFACGILADESGSSYTWLLHMFLKAMCQRKPESIITDSDNAMMKAIRQILPGTNHRVCSWHVEKGIKKHLHHSYLSIFRSFIYDACSPAVFEDKWNAFVEKYQTNRNRDWLNRMYRKRRLWAAAFLCDKYFLGMRSNQRSESLNSRLHRHLDNYMSLVDLQEHYEVCVSGMRRREAEFDSRASQSWPVAVTDNRELEQSAAHAFTSVNFDLVQEELRKLDNFDVGEVQHDGNCMIYNLTSKETQGGVFSVEYTSLGSDSTIKCSCRKMERDGIPCKHILRVLKHLEITEIPKCCVLRRLSKNAKGGLPSIRKSDLHVWTQKQARYHELSALGSELFDLASNTDEGYVEVKEYILGQISMKKSYFNPADDTRAYVDENDATVPRAQGLARDPNCVVTKGAPRGRIKSFDDRRPRLCSRCHKSGHDIRRCPAEVQEE